MADFLSLGEMLIDFTPAGRTPAGIPLFEQNPGGAPANVAVQAARLGVSAGFIGKVGRDMFGAFLQQTLEQNGVETANLRFSAETAISAFTATRARTRSSALRRSTRRSSTARRCSASARCC